MESGSTLQGNTPATLSWGTWKGPLVQATASHEGSQFAIKFSPHSPLWQSLVDKCRWANADRCWCHLMVTLAVRYGFPLRQPSGSIFV